MGTLADHYIDLFWVRLLPYLSTVKPGQTQHYRLLVRNNLGGEATYEARLLGPPGWQVDEACQSITLEPGGCGEIQLTATAPSHADHVRRLLTAEVRINDINQGPISEALVTVAD